MNIILAGEPSHSNESDQINLLLMPCYIPPAHQNNGPNPTINSKEIAGKVEKTNTTTAGIEFVSHPNEKFGLKEDSDGTI